MSSVQQKSTLLDEEKEKLRQIEQYRKNKIAPRIAPSGQEMQLKARISALQEIIQIQSLEIANHANASPIRDHYKSNIQVSLLNKWREKVFELLVQLKSQNLVDKSPCKQCQMLNDSLQKAQKTLTEELSGIRAMKQQFLQLQKQNLEERDEAIRRVLLESDKTNTALREELSNLQSELSKKNAHITRIERTVSLEKEEMAKSEEFQRKKLVEKEEEIRLLKEAIRKVLLESDKMSTALREELSNSRSEVSKKNAQITRIERMLSLEKEEMTKSEEFQRKKLVEKDEEIRLLKEEKVSLLNALKNVGQPCRTSETPKDTTLPSSEKIQKQAPERDIMIQALDNLATLTHHYMSNNTHNGDYLDDI